MNKPLLVPERAELLARINKHLLRGDKALIAAQTGFTMQYVKKVLSPSFSAYSLRIVDAALKLANRRELEQTERERMTARL